jgi:hypothetical protein
MIELVKNWYQSKVEAGRVSLEEARQKQAARRMMTTYFEEATNLVTEKSDAGGWSLTGASNVGHNLTDQVKMIQQARKFYRFDPNGRASLQNLVYYVIGEGVKITPQSQDERVHRLWREFWEAPRNMMGLRQNEIVLRTFRDGEVMLQYFGADALGAKTWKTSVRFRDPELCVDPGIEFAGPGGAGSQGIKVDPDDPETPIEFYFKKAYDSSTIERLPADQIQHLKIFADSEQKRGESFIQPVMDLFAQYKDWLRYRIILNKVRTAIVLIRKVEGGTSDDVKAIAGKIAQSSTSREGVTQKKAPNPGTIINAGAGVDYKFESANINATDAAEDGRNIKLGMAAGTTEPEYIFGDASNANYASTLIAEAPFVKSVKYWQKFFEYQFKEMYRRVLKQAVDAGKLTAPAEEDIFLEPGVKQIAEAVNPVAKADSPQGADANGSELDQSQNGPSPDQPPKPGSQISEAEAFWGCDIQWPEIIHRDIKETTDSMIAQVNAGLVSEPTASQILGHDYDEEVRRQQQVELEAETNPFKKSSNPFEDPATSAEMNDLMNSLSPEESQNILKSNDPAQIVAMLKARKGPTPPPAGGKKIPTKLPGKKMAMPMGAK